MASIHHLERIIHFQY